MATWGDIPPPPPPGIGNRKKDFGKSPQELVGEFWDKFFAKKPGKVTSIFPRSLYATLLPPSQPRGASSTRNAAESYEAAAKECREKVRRIVRESNRTNEKFTDPDFDIEADPDNNCLNGLVRDESDPSGDGDGLPVSAGQLQGALDTLVSSRVLGSDASVPVNVDEMRKFIGSSSPWAALFGSAGGAASGPVPPHNFASKDAQRHTEAHGARGGGLRARGGVRGGEAYYPGSIHRLDWIFDSPQFTIDGYSSSDIKQGGDGDCWWLAAVATIAHRKDLMDKVCVARDEECGVYGFVFQRDGEWVSTVVDDNLYLANEDFDFYGDMYDSTGKRARQHRKEKQTGSEALYFGKCDDPNETWLPLLEKAYAKIHGDYEAISGGWSGEAVEDMTGGVTTTMATNRVLKKDKLWRELVNSNGEFVFALSAIGTGWDSQKGGLALGHAYSILKATEEVDEEGKKFRLVQIRNPWGERSYNGVGEWNGPWSDGSKEWTPYWLKKLNHTFGDDGVFWMSFQDMLETFLFLHRTRLFDEKWTVVQQWSSVNVAWVSGYLNTKFVVEVKKGGMVVIALTQLDDRYFQGFEGQYRFTLHFVLQQENGEAGDHICRVRPVHDWENRSVSCEIELEPGRYEVVPKIMAERDPDARMVEDVVREWADKNPQKLRQVGMQYDLAHAKGGVPDEDEILAARKEEEKKKAEEKKRKRKERARREKVKIEVTTKDEKAKITIETTKKTEDDKEEDKFEDALEDKAKTEENARDAAAAAQTEKPETKDDEKKKDEVPKEEKAAEPKTAEPKEAAKSGEKPAVEDAKSVEKADQGTAKAENTEEKQAGEGKGDENADDEDDEEEEGNRIDAPPPTDDDSRTPWNAVCVVGLRVYSKDSEVSISLVKPKTPEEAASLTVSGQPAGATS